MFWVIYIVRPGVCCSAFLQCSLRVMTYGIQMIVVSMWAMCTFNYAPHPYIYTLDLAMWVINLNTVNMLLYELWETFAPWFINEFDSGVGSEIHVSHAAKRVWEKSGTVWSILQDAAVTPEVICGCAIDQPFQLWSFDNGMIVNL